MTHFELCYKRNILFCSVCSGPPSFLCQNKKDMNENVWGLHRPSANPLDTKTQFHVLQKPVSSGQAPPTAPPPANPYDILGIPRSTTDEEVVNSAYRKWAAMLHPDRGGDPARFQVVQDAYRRIKEQLDYARSESFEELKMRAERELGDFNTPGGGEVRQELAPLGAGSAFDKSTFNQVFHENRMWNPNEDGYGDKMEGSTFSSSYDKLKDIPSEVLHARDVLVTPTVMAPAPTFNTGNLVSFNSAFKQNAAQLQTKRAPTQSLVKRVEPESLGMCKAGVASTCSSLSYEKVEDFSSPFSAGSAAAVGYTDYMKAFSEDALVTQPTGFDAGYGRSGNVSDAEYRQAVNKIQQISFVPDVELINAKAKQDAYEREQDELRFRNFLKRNEDIDERHRHLRNVLPERSRAQGK